VRTNLKIVPFLATFILLMFVGLAYAGVFEDVPRTHWAYDAVDYLVKKGLVEGYPDGTYKGDRTLTRYEFAQVIARAYAAIEELVNKGGEVAIDTEAIINDLMEEFGPEIEDLRKLANETKARVDDLEKKLQDNSTKDADLAAKLEKIGTKIKFNGIMKLRWEGKYYDQPGNARIQRPRISFRFDLSAPVNDEVTFGGRLGTGGVGSNVASETTLTSVFGIKAFDLERAYLQWNPANWPNWTFTCGKFAPNWVSPWNFLDADVNMEGLAETYKQDNWVVNLAEMIPAEKGGYIVAQVGAKDIFVKGIEAYLSYHFVSPGAFETLWTGYPYWFRVDDDKYTAVEACGMYSFEYSGWPIKLTGAYRQGLFDAVNIPGPDSALNQAAMAQIDVGKISEVGDYKFCINYSRILPNAVVPQFADSTNGVDHDAWTVWVDYQLQPNTLFKLRYTRADNVMAHPDEGFDAILADIICNF